MCRPVVLIPLLSVLFPGLFLLFSCGKGASPGDLAGGMKAFEVENIFLGKGENDELIVEAHYRSQYLEGDKLHLKMMFLPSENFDFEEEYRGFSRRTYYKLKKNTKLVVTAAGEELTFKLQKSHTARSIEPFDVDFERKKMTDFIPDSLDSMMFPFKGVKKWEKVNKENVGKWSKTKDTLRKEAERRREARRKKIEAEKSGEEYDGSSGFYVSVNSTYLYEKRDTSSRILAKLPLGTFLETSKPAGTDWYEIEYGDPPVKGFILSLMVSRSAEEASFWEEDMHITPVETPLEPEADSTVADE